LEVAESEGNPHPLSELLNRLPPEVGARHPMALQTVRGGARRRMAPSTFHGGVTQVPRVWQRQKTGHFLPVGLSR
jgi:hypothetical protein